MKRIHILSVVILMSVCCRAQVNNFFEVNQTYSIIASYCSTDTGGIVVMGSTNVIHDLQGNVTGAFFSTGSNNEYLGHHPFLHSDGFVYSFGSDASGSLIFCKGDQSGNILRATQYAGGNFNVAAATAISDDTSFCTIIYDRLIRFDTAGNYLFWNKITIDSGVGSQFRHICVTPQHEYLLSGSAPNLHFYIAKFDPLGNFLWARFYNSPGMELSYDVDFGADNSYYISGKTSAGEGITDYLLIKTDTAGNVLFAKTYGDSLNNDNCEVIALPDSTLIFAGTTFHGTNPTSDADITIARLDRNGNILWCNRYGLRNDAAFDYRERLYDLQPVDDSTFTVISNISYLGPPNYTAGWIFTENINGNAPSVCERQPWSLTINPQPVADTAFSCTVQPLSFSAQTLATVQIASQATQIDQCTYVGLHESSVQTGIKVYPNPSTDVVRFECGTDSDVKTICIYNSLGATVLQMQSSAALTEISCSGLSSGIYSYTVLQADGKMFSGKIVIHRP